MSKRILFWLVFSLVLILLTVGLAQAQGPLPQRALSTAFTYQGQLWREGGPAQGLYDLRFSLWDAASEGRQIGSTQTVEGVQVSNGNLNVGLDLGADAFDGNDRYLQIEVRRPAEEPEFTTLSPRQQLAAVPYALYARSSSWANLSGVPHDLLDGDGDALATLVCNKGQVAKWNGSSWSCSDDKTTVYTTGPGFILNGYELSVAFGGSGSANTVARSDHEHDSRYIYQDKPRSISAVMLQGGAVTTWHLWDGTTLAEILDDDGEGSGLDSDLLDGQDSASYRDASQINAGQLKPDYYSAYSDLQDEGHLNNDAAADLLTRAQGDERYWSIGGSGGLPGSSIFLGAGENRPLELRVNSARALLLQPTSTTPNLIGGSSSNQVSPGVAGAIIGGGGVSGAAHLVADDYGTIGGGLHHLVGTDNSNTTDASYATVSGGYTNRAASSGATVGGGYSNQATGVRATVSGGESNRADGPATAVGGGYNNVAAGERATISGGYNNNANGPAATVGGGYNNEAGGTRATIAGGEGNKALGDRATVGGGLTNEAGGYRATVAGGYVNNASGPSSTIGGGYNNLASGNLATISGGYNNKAILAGTTVGGGYSNEARSDLVTISGGYTNRASGDVATIGGGYNNETGAERTTIAGGENNRALAAAATVSGGYSNEATGERATIGGGGQNKASGFSATIGGGYLNAAAGFAGTVAGGYSNAANGFGATAIGGRESVAAGDYSLAAGRQAKANQNGSWVWADSTPARFPLHAGR